MRILRLILLSLTAASCAAQAVKPTETQGASSAPATAPTAPSTAPAAAAPATRLVAVLAFRSKLAGAERASVDADYLADAVRAAALRSKAGLRVMTRENMLVLLQAAGKDLSECEGECEVDTGRRLGADLVVSGDLLRFGSSYKLDLRLHATSSGELLSGAAASGATPDKLDQAVGPAVQELFAPLIPGGVSESSAPAATPLVSVEAAPPRRAVATPVDSVQTRLRFPESATCQGNAYEFNRAFPTRGGFRIVARTADSITFHYEVEHTRGAPKLYTVDNEVSLGANGGLNSHAKTNHGDLLSGSTPGWAPRSDGEALIISGTLRTALGQTFQYQNTWTRVGERLLTSRNEMLIGARWVTAGEDRCTW